jgi:hypothetical protein
MASLELRKHDLSHGQRPLTEGLIDTTRSVEEATPGWAIGMTLPTISPIKGNTRRPSEPSQHFPPVTEATGNVFETEVLP